MKPRRWLTMAGLSFGILVATTAPAAADPPRPTDYRSTITGGASGDGFEVDVVGGDSLLRLRVEAGHEVVVLGYRDEPYLRVRADGTVEENLRSEATYVNDDRYGEVGALPSEVDAAAEPDWRPVGEGGTYAWHDHRIHWMSPARPDGVDPGETVLDWEVPLVVDGREATVAGTLTLEPSPSPLPWVALAAVIAAVGFVVVRRRVALIAAAAAVAAVAALAVGLGELVAIPPEAGRNPFVVAIPVAGLVGAVTAYVARHRPVNVPALAAAACALGWAALRWQVLVRPVLPTNLPPAIDRAGTAVAMGAGLAVALVAVAGPRRSPTRSPGAST